MRIFVVIGTRPEAIKMLPLVNELRKYDELETKICFSFQHEKIAFDVFREFELSPDFVFEGMEKGIDLCDMTRRFLKYFDRLFKMEKPDLVLVHGDTTTAFCAALSAFYAGIRVGHVEAGLRTFDNRSPFPEEFNRVSIDALSNIHFAPTNSARDNLIKEGIKSVFTVGNTVVDAVRYSLSTDVCLPILDGVSGRKLLLATTHRRENLGNKMRYALLGIRDLLEARDDLFAILPVHPNPAVRKVVFEVFGDIKNMKICEPLSMREFHHILSLSYAVFTDSGGIQEEAAYLGVPLFLLRENTEREECLNLSNVCMVGCDRERVRGEFLLFLSSSTIQEKMRTRSFVFGDGHSSERIAECLIDLTKGG